MNIRRRSSVFVFYIIACNTAIWRYENKRVNLFWRDEESQPFQRKYASYELLPELATISWIACLLASAEGPVLHSLSPCQSSQVNWPQTLRGNYCTCSWSLSSINGEKMTSCARVYWICHFNSWISYPRLCFIAFQMKFNYPVPSHFQFSGRDGSGTWKKVRDGSGTGIPSDPGYIVYALVRNCGLHLLRRRKKIFSRRHCVQLIGRILDHNAISHLFARASQIHIYVWCLPCTIHTSAKKSCISKTNKEQ